MNRWRWCGCEDSVWCRRWQGWRDHLHADSFPQVTFLTSQCGHNKHLGWTRMTELWFGGGAMFSYINTLFTGGTVLTSLACAWLISIRLLGAEKQQLPMIITIYLNNEAARALYWQTKGQKLAERSCVCLFVRVCVCVCIGIFNHWIHAYLHLTVFASI